MSKHKGLRYNSEKLRFDLIPAFPQEQYAKVLTEGAKKYEDRNWELGMSWSTVIASLKRHLHAFESGEDFDPETGLLHMAHAMCNCAFLVQYYKTYPQGDDRPHSYMMPYRVGLDIDEVIAGFIPAWQKRFNTDMTPEFWAFDSNMKAKMEDLSKDKTFWVNEIKPIIDPKDIGFEPVCYITSRPIPTEWCAEWLEYHGFPCVPVFSIEEAGMSKTDICRDQSLDMFVDDRYETFVEMNKAGVCCFLMDAPHNRRYDVGYKRIDNLKSFF